MFVFVPYLTAAIVIVGSILSESPVVFSLLFAFIVLPIADLLSGEEEFEVNEEPILKNLPLFLWVPLQLGSLGVITFFASQQSVLVALSWAVPAGLITGGIGIIIAHELGHKYRFWHRLCAKLLFVSVLFPGFPIEHNLGHHTNVATHSDPATARAGESLWAFLLRTVPGQYIGAWKIESMRLKKLGKYWFTPRNEMMNLTAACLGIVAGILTFLGPAACVFFVAQAVIAVFLLQAINYIEHYGLLRKYENGKLERVTPEHSWDTNWKLSNYLLFRLQQHADHHANPRKDFHALRPMANAPQMPASYPTMILFAMIPPLWRWLVEPK